ncbi:M28 family peptidase [Nocardioides sp.]|uniref:M28 family peptidase n=1 Tax=Nocardioides sp. TaxID=35761 RepID=UPI003514CA77
MLRSIRTTGRRGRRVVLTAAVAMSVLLPALARPTADAAPSAPPTRPELASTEQIMSTVRDLVGFAPRSTGSVGGLRAAEYVADRFRRAGLTDVHYETATAYDWNATGASLEVGGRVIDSFPITHSFIAGADIPSTRTLGPDGATAPVVDIGAGGVGNADVKGKWVLFDLKFRLPLAALIPLMTFFWDPQLTLLDPATLLSANPYITNQASVVKAAQAKGALGVIGVLSDYFDSNRYRNEFYRRSPMTVPGVWVTKKEGALLRQRLQTTPVATMRMTVERKAVTARTVVGFLEGRTKDTVMVQSHHDSQGPGAVEDGTGTAEVIALADYYGAKARQPGYRPREKTLMFTTFDTHFTGYQQHTAFAKKYVVEKRTPYRIVANTTIEHVGKRAVIGKDGSLQTLERTEPRGIFENLNLPLKLALARALVRNDLRSTAVLNGTLPAFLGGIPTDASFALITGIPVVSLIAGPLYMYDDADTLDKVDQAQLRPVATFFADVLDAIERTPSAAIGLGPLLSPDPARALG